MNLKNPHQGPKKPLAAAVTACLITPLSLAQNDVESGGRYSLQLEEVVVTAQKREENFMTVPVTVNAFTAQDIINGIRRVFNVFCALEDFLSFMRRRT